MKFCLIGEKLSHSYSEEIHKMNNLDYSLCEIARGNLKSFDLTKYDGLNVTIPYKQDIFDYLNEIDVAAKEIGAVNTVLNKNGILIGYNTDYLGMIDALNKAEISITDKNVIILGSGGTSKTAFYVCKKLNAKNITIVSRNGVVDYSNVYEKCPNTNVIINTTPVGMFPNINDCPIELNNFKFLEGVFDCIYNPLRTKLVLDALNLGLKAAGGLYMLVSQALEAQKIWGFEKLTKDEVYNNLINIKENIVLMGMPSCGKTTIGKLLSKKLNRKLIDVDNEIANQTGLYPSDIIKVMGEDYFRNIESDVIKNISKNNSCIISLGGGSILRKVNVDNIKKNGKIIYVVRDLTKLSSKNRPISQKKGNEQLFNTRKDIYNSCCDMVVENNGTLNEVVDKIVVMYENISY